MVHAPARQCAAQIWLCAPVQPRQSINQSITQSMCSTQIVMALTWLHHAQARALVAAARMRHAQCGGCCHWVGCCCHCCGAWLQLPAGSLPHRLTLHAWLPLVGVPNVCRRDIAPRAGRPPRPQMNHGSTHARPEILLHGACLHTLAHTRTAPAGSIEPRARARAKGGAGGSEHAHVRVSKLQSQTQCALHILTSSASTHTHARTHTCEAPPPVTSFR